MGKGPGAPKESRLRDPQTRKNREDGTEMLHDKLDGRIRNNPMAHSQTEVGGSQALLP
jgi:hypothetical protein